jgi:triosephosphate isomerase
MRKKIVVGNWKMNVDLSESINLIESIKKIYDHSEDVEVCIAPSFPFLKESSELCQGEKIKVLAQNVNDNLKGAFTGEVSIDMLKSINVDGVIIGHSERREYYNEDDDLLLRKLQVSLDNNFNVFFCVGESLLDRKKNNHFEKVKNQLEKTVFKIDNVNPENLVLAYEPVWAIGTGLTASPEQAQEIHKYIRNLVCERYGKKISDNISIIYGGSVKPSSAKEIFEKEDVDGGLIGGASLSPQDFIDVVRSI